MVMTEPRAASIAVPRTDVDIRCPHCKRLIGDMATRPWKLWCRHCKTAVQPLDIDQRRRLG